MGTWVQIQVFHEQYCPFLDQYQPISSYFGTALDNSLLLGGQAPKWASVSLFLKVRAHVPNF